MLPVGFHHSEEAKRKIGEASKGRKRSPEVIVRIAEANRGRRASPETITKLRMSHLGKKPSSETLQKRSDAMKIRWLSPEYREKVIKGTTGKKRPEEFGKKLSQMFKGKNGSGYKHGMAYSSTYGSWEAMISRCERPSHPKFHLYGGRGITICNEWRNDFRVFFRDMGERPLGKTLDRIDNDKGYCKENCRWATLSEQGANRRKYHKIRP